MGRPSLDRKCVDMQGRYCLVALILFLSAALTSCGGAGGGSSTSTLPQTAPQPNTSSSATQSYPLSESGGTYAIPALNGFSGSLVFPAANVPPQTTVTLTSSLNAPTGMAAEDVARRAQATGSLNVYFYATVVLSKTVTFRSVPGFSIKLPSTINTSGQQFYYAISKLHPLNGADQSFRTEGPATVSGHTLTFSPSSVSLTFQGGEPYVLALYSVSAPNFKTSFGGYAQVIGGNPPASVVIAGTGIGVDASGDSHASFTQTIVFTTNPNQINDGHFTFSYADGSTLTGTYSGTSTPPNSHGYTNGSGRFKVTTGTGRFAKTAGNTGTWTVSAQLFPPGSSPAATINVTFQGSLTL